MIASKETFRVLLAAVLAFLSCAAASYLYSLIVHGQGVPDWKLAVQMSIVLGIVTALQRTGWLNP